MIGLIMNLYQAKMEYLIGTPVRYYPITGDDHYVKTTIRSQPWELGHGEIVVKVAGRAGGVAVSNIEVDNNEQRIYEAVLKTRKEMERTIPRDDWGWWIDVCPGKTLRLRDATEADIKRCHLKDTASKRPSDYLCELTDNGWLVSKKAIKKLLLVVPLD